MRNRRIQRALKRAGVVREERIDRTNAEMYPDPVPFQAVEEIRKPGRVKR